MLSPSTVISFASSGLVAGPFFGEPSSIENLLPWQVQLIVPPSTPATGQPWCEQVALNALKLPALGWVTTTPWAAKTLPPPSGISLVLASSSPALPAGAVV